jgi:hypothetical protein
VAAILRSPDDYFVQARIRAWLEAGDDVEADLARRATRRRAENGLNGAWSGRPARRARRR